MHVDGGLAVEELAAGAIAVHLLRDGYPVVRLPLSPALQVVAANAFVTGLSSRPIEPYATAIAQLDALLGNGWTGHPSVAATGTLLAGRALFHRVTTEPLADPDQELAPVLVPVGLRSADQSALLGRDGQIFLIGGSNRLLAEYVRDDRDPIPDDHARAWLALMRRRRAGLSALGARYVQAIFPDKLTVLPDCFPDPLRTPGAVLRRIEDGLAQDPELAASYVSARHALDAQPDRAATLLKTDSHFSALGCWVVFRAVLDHLGLDAGRVPAFDVVRAGTGDLATRFFGIPLLDIRREADLNCVDAAFRARARRTFHRSEADRVTGTAQSWHNPEAPIDASILVFGNSYCGLADGHQGQMSWWFARWFRTYHFVWHARMSPGLVEKLRPDIVFCHTVERFLVEVPDT
jgi:hypothetical protein